MEKPGLQLFVPVITPFAQDLSVDTSAFVSVCKDLLTYSASESLIPQNARAGGAGCISASANVNAAGIRRLIDAVGTEDEAACHAQVSAVRSLFEGLPLIPAVKAAAARQHRAPGLARVRPPFVAAGEQHAKKFAEAVSLAGSQWE